MESERKITRCMIFFTLKISIGLSVGVKNGVAARVVYRTVTQQLSRIVLLSCRSPLVLLLPGRLFMFSLFFSGHFGRNYHRPTFLPLLRRNRVGFPTLVWRCFAAEGRGTNRKFQRQRPHNAWEAHGGLDHHPDCAGLQDADQPRNASRLANTFELKANDLCLLTMLLLSVYCTCSTSSTRIASGQIIAIALLPAAPCPNVPCSDAAPHLCKVLSESSTMADISLLGAGDDTWSIPYPAGKISASISLIIFGRGQLWRYIVKLRITRPRTNS